jgi:hypothetical protein
MASLFRSHKTTLQTWMTLLVYLGLAVALLWPATQPGSGLVPGGARTDVWNSIWSMWFAHGAISSGELPWTTLLLHHPTGGSVLLPDPLGALFGAATIPLIGPSGSYTAWLVFQLTLSGFITHRFAADWLTTTGLESEDAHRAGWVAGVGYISAPVLLAGAQCGTTEAVGGAWPALAAWMVWRAANGLGVHSSVRAALALLLAAISSWYGAVVAFVFAGLLALSGRRIGWHHRLWPVALGLLLVLPYALFTQSTHSDVGHLGTRSMEILQNIRASFGSADLQGMFLGIDTANIATLGPQERGEGYLHTAYLGWVLTIASVISLLRRTPGATVLGVAGLVCGLLALGPNIHWDGTIITSWGLYRLVETLPGFDGLSLLWRLGMGTSLALALLAASATRGHKAAVVAICVLTLAEVRFLSPLSDGVAATDTSQTAALHVLRDAPPGAVLTIPSSHQHQDLWRQTIHQHPVTGNINQRRGRKAAQWARQINETDWPKTKSQAEAIGVRFVIVISGGELRTSSDKSLAEQLNRELKPLSTNGRMKIYALW